MASYFLVGRATRSNTPLIGGINTKKSSKLELTQVIRKISHLSKLSVAYAKNIKTNKLENDHD